MDLVNQITNQATKFLADNPNGRHIKSISEKGVVFGRNTEIIKDLAPVINGINFESTIGEDDDKEGKSTIQIYIPYNGRDPMPKNIIREKDIGK